jgi:hypothetical protein
MELDIEMNEERKNKTAFDFDGVFIPDCDKIPTVGDTLEFYELTMYMKPIFEPVGEWYLLTARLAEHEEMTKSWMLKHFKNQPKEIYHSRTNDEAPEAYKLRMVKEKDIDVFVESDPMVVRHIQRELPDMAVVHFADFCQIYLNYNAGT